MSALRNSKGSCGGRVFLADERDWCLRPDGGFLSFLAAFREFEGLYPA